MSERTASGGADLDEVRRRARELRRSIRAEARRRAEDAIVRNVLDLPELAVPGDVALYLPTDGEADLGEAAAELRSRRATLWLPLIGPQRSMRVAQWNASDQLHPNRYGILEPATTAPTRAVVDVDVVLVPCVAVDADGNRVGFGAGYYDRALAASSDGSRPLCVGIAFDQQVVDRLDPAPWDVPLDVVVTDVRVLRPNAHDPG